MENLIIKTKAEVIASKEAFVTTYKPIAGWKSVLLSWEDEMDCHTPWQTSYFAYGTEAEAIEDAKAWAWAEEIAYVPRE
jgi:hypothetical protein